MRGLIVAVTLYLGAAGAMAADKVQLVFSEFYPISHTEKGQPAGPGVELMRELTKGLPVEFHTQSTPLKRMLVMAPSRPLIVAALIRTSRRETDFDWIGELYRDSLVMVTAKPNPRIDDLEQARSLGHIGVTLGGVAEALLRERKFTNFEASLDMTAQARKLASNRVDGWCALRQSARSAWRVTGHDPADLQMGPEIMDVSIWIAASKSVPREMVAELKRRFAALDRNGTLAAELGELRGR